MIYEGFMILLRHSFVAFPMILVLFLILIPFVAYFGERIQKTGVITLHPKWGMPAHIQKYWESIGKFRVFKKKTK